MTKPMGSTTDRLAHYQAWVQAWRTVTPSQIPAEQCLNFLSKNGHEWLRTPEALTTQALESIRETVACFKTAKEARLICLGGKVPPSCDACDVLSESFDARVKCDCSGLYPVPANFDPADLKSCGCKAIERMMAEGELVNQKADEWNSSDFFTSEGLTSATTELALCHADIQPLPFSCSRRQGLSAWPEVQAPDRKPSKEVDLDEEIYHSLYPTAERIRLSADAKHFFAIASGASLVDPGVQMAIADSGNDILIGDYCDAATDDKIRALQKEGAAAFAFLKICVISGLMTDWQFDHLVAQIILFRIMSYWRDHALSRRPRGVHGSRMTGMGIHRHIDLGMVLGIVSSSMASGETMNAEEYKDLVRTTVLLNDLLDFRGDTWRNQRENVVLRGVRGCLCEYLDEKICSCIGGAADMVGRGKNFVQVILCFCNWLMMSSGHKIYETLHGTRLVDPEQICHYRSKDGVYQKLLEALESYGTLGKEGPDVTMKRKELQIRYAEHRRSPESHIKWMVDIVRIILHPDNLRRLVDVVHFEWTGELGNVEYCA